MENEHHKKVTRLNLGSLFFGLILIMAGLFFIGSQSGFVPFVPVQPFFWLEFLWPLLFITIGLSLIRVRSVGAKVLGVLATFAIVLFIVLFFLQRFSFGQQYHLRETDRVFHWTPRLEIHKVPNGFNVSF